MSWNEEYSLSWPGLQLLAPTSPRCPVVFKGEETCCCCCCCCCCFEVIRFQGSCLSCFEGTAELARAAAQHNSKPDAGYCKLHIHMGRLYRTAYRHCHMWQQYIAQYFFSPAMSRKCCAGELAISCRVTGLLVSITSHNRHFQGAQSHAPMHCAARTTVAVLQMCHKIATPEVPQNLHTSILDASPAC
jgi:hypothetical protein